MSKLGYSKKGKTPVTSRMIIDSVGTAERLGGFMTASTIAFVNGTPSTITDSASGFLSKMLKAGTRIEISGSAHNDGQYNVDSVVAGTITLEAGVALTDELAGSPITIFCVSRVFCKSVIIQALEANGTVAPSNIIVGGVNVAMSTYMGVLNVPLGVVTLDGIFLDEIYIDVEKNGDGAMVTYIPVLTI